MPKQPPTVIAGSPQPSFRRKPESRAALREPSLRRSGPQPSFRPPNRHSGKSRNPVQHCVNHPYAVAAPNRHSGASRNPVQHCEPSLHRSNPQPSFRRKPESMPADSITVCPQPSFRPPNRHSGASRNPVQHCVNHPYAEAAPTRHSGASRNLWRAVTFTVIPARRNPTSAARRLLTFRRHHSLSLWHGQSDCAHPLRPAPGVPSVRPDFRPPNPARQIQNPQNSPQTMTPVCLTLRNLSAILSPIR